MKKKYLFEEIEFSLSGFCLLYYPRNHRRWVEHGTLKQAQTNGEKRKRILVFFCLFGVILRGYNRAQCHNVVAMYQLMSS